MIKVGDKLHHQGKEWNVEFTSETFVHLKHGDDFIIESSHIFWNKLYVEQKLRADDLEDMLNKEVEENYQMENRWRTEIERADRAEKRWSELREQMEHDEKEAFGEGDVIAYTVHNYVLELMHDLEEESK